MGKAVAEHLVLTKIAIELLLLNPFCWRVFGLLCDNRQVGPKRIIRFNDAAIFARAVTHARPKCLGQCKTINRCPFGQSVAQNGQDKARVPR